MVWYAAPMSASVHPTTTAIHVTDIEAAINHWRRVKPSSDGASLSVETRALAEVYGLMAWWRQEWVDQQNMSTVAYAAWLAWYDTTPDTPCIAICSTSQGDAQCKGCGRSVDEVQHWTALSPVVKRQVWRRITLSGQAWRFNRYAERATMLGTAGAFVADTPEHQAGTV